MKKTLFLLLAAITVAACGGAQEEQEILADKTNSSTSTQDGPSDSRNPSDGPNRRLAVSTASAPGDAATQLMNFAEISFPQFFPSKRSNSSAGTWIYRHYPETGAFLIIDGEKVFVASGPFGPSIMFVGVISDFLGVSFGLQSAFQARIVAGSTDRYSVSGSCTGTASITAAPASAALFEGALSFSSTSTATLSLLNCQPASAASTATSYFDANYGLIGSSNIGVEYTKITSPSSVLPATVRVGDSGIYNTLTIYSNSSKSTITGQRVLSYVVEADTPSTAIVNLITRSYNTAGQLLVTQQNRFRIDGSGKMTSLSIDVQFSTTSTTRLIYTRLP